MSSTAEELYQHVCQHARETAVWTGIEAALGWDERTRFPRPPAPIGPSNDRLSGMVHRRWTDPQSSPTWRMARARWPRADATRP